jgi:hypothetical protein
MVFCKLTKKVSKKIKNAEQAIEDTATTTKDTINTHIRTQLTAIDNKKVTLLSKIQDKLERQKQHINATIIQPHQTQRRTNMAMMFYVDLSLTIVLGLFLYKIYPMLKSIISRPAFTKEQYDQALKMPETAYSREDLRLAAEYRKSFQDWKDFYKKDDAFSDYNVGTTEIQRGSTLREPVRFMIQYVIPYVILAYVVWFLVKYIKYVIAAIWGFFVMVYQFVTKKITCKLAEKWYIRLGTGWSRCHPKFNQYVDKWQRNYITRPVAQERITYLKGVHGVKAKYGDKPHLTLWNRLWDWLYDWKRIYLDQPLQELYLQLIGFHPVYVVQPYELLASREKAYDSKTKSGKVCKCPPRKTAYRKLKTYLETQPQQRLQNKLVAFADSVSQTKTATHAQAAKLASKAGGGGGGIIDGICGGSDEDDDGDNKNKNKKNKKNKKKSTKTIAQGIWTLFMIVTVCAVLFGLLQFKQLPRAMNKPAVWAALATYLALFIGGGIYSFLI